MIYASGEAGQVYCVDPASRSVAEVGSTHGWTHGLALDPHGNVYA